jgi:outer membrane receptor protein involved in Fe transport
MKTAVFAMCTVLIALVSAESFAQTGSLYGRIYDEKTGGELTGASVLLIGTTFGASTDLDGKYSIQNIPVGKYEVRISFAGYNTKTVTDVEIKPGESLKLDVSLTAVGAEAYVIEDMVVSAERVLSTAAAVLADRKKSAVIGDAISADQISKSADGTSGDALKRVTGLSVVDEKFVFVRGVTDRYNGTSLNGVTVTSTDTDVDKKSFSFDMIPASLLSNSVVVKTATPDLPGDFSGGLVQVNTLDFPANRVIKLSLSSSRNSDVTGERILASLGGGKDYLGYDDGSRALPDGADLDCSNCNSIVSELPNNWRMRGKKAPLNGSYGVTYGDRFNIGEDELGVIGSFQYKNKYNKADFSEKPTFTSFFDGTRYKRSILWGGLLNLNYKPSALHKLSFKNNYIQTGEEKVNIAEGLPETGEWTKRYTIEWDERSLYLTQLSGEHKLQPLRDLEIQWKGFLSKSEAREPDKKSVEFELAGGGVYALKDSNIRSWSELKEDSRGLDVDFTMPIGDRKLKFGALTEKRDRDFTMKAFATTTRNLDFREYWHLPILPLETIFDSENYGRDKFTFEPTTDFTGDYDAEHRLTAAYAMLDYPFELFRQRFRFVGGVRIEDSDQKVNTVDDPGKPQPLPFQARVDKTDFLPSLNFTYAINNSTNLRIAHSHSVNRPEFREMANVFFYDFDRIQNVVGNPNLARALIRNYDVRLELFPDIGEVLAVSYFYKDIRQAIEEKLLPAPDRYTRTWFNSPKGSNRGYEIEARKSFGFIHDYLSNFSVTGNYTQVWSEIEYRHVDTDVYPHVISTKTRDMQGQSPWMVNLSFMFTEPTLGTTFNLLYNKIGRRLDAVMDDRDDDIYEEPYGVVDMAVTQKLPWNAEAKFTVKNLNSTDKEYTRGPDGEQYSLISAAKVYSFSLSLNF